MCISAAARDVLARARGVRVCLSDGAGLASSGVLMSAAAPGGFLPVRCRRCPFVVALVARLPSVALWRRAWPSVVFFCRCRLDGRAVSKSRLWSQFRPRLLLSACRRVALTLGGGSPALFLRVCVGAHLPQPSCVKFSS